jgi:hypothetical protein
MNGHSIHDYDPDTGLLRGDDHYRDQAETTEKREALAAAWAPFFMDITEEPGDVQETASGSGTDRDRGVSSDPYSMRQADWERRLGAR